MNLAESLLHALKAAGAGQVFGIPGDFALPFFRVIEESRILPLYTLSHEPSVGYAADAASRIRSEIAVAAVTYGAGALNMVNPVAAAYAEKSPLVVISGAPGKGESQAGLLLHHQAKQLDSQMRVYQEVTCDQARLDDAAQAPAAVARVLASCKRHSRPVYVEVPRDMVGVECAPVPVLAPPPVDAEALAACVEEILARIRGARRPVLMVGVEVRRFGLEAQVAEMARRLGVPVVTSLLGRGLLTETDYPPAGTYLGLAGEPAITQMVEDSDALLLFGVIVSDTNFGVSGKHIDMRRAVCVLDGQVKLGYHVYPELPIADVVEAMLARLPAVARAGVAAPPRPGSPPPGDGPILPADIAEAINRTMARHGRFPIAADTGDCLFTAMGIEHAPIVAPAYYATMGFGVPAGLALQAATGQRPLVLVGDGAFQMTGWELGNCARYGWDPIVVVFNNAGWEMLRVFQPQSAFNDIGEWRFADLANAMGGEGRRVRTPRELQTALDEAVARRGRFQLIEAMIPRGAVSPTLQRFVDGVKRVAQRPSG